MLGIFFACYWVAMFIGTHIPQQLPNLDVGFFDKVVHFAAYLGLTLLFALCWQTFGGHLTLRHYIVIAIVVIAYGAIDEILQSYVHRDCNFYDWLADILGTLTGLNIFHYGRPWLVRFIKTSEGNAGNDIQ